MSRVEELINTCKSATVEDLDEMLYDNNRTLSEFICPVCHQDINWNKIDYRNVHSNL